jgi:hypothetical protein
MIECANFLANMEDECGNESNELIVSLATAPALVEKINGIKTRFPDNCMA